MPPKETTLHVRNMVCPRCVRVVREELTALGLDVRSVVLGAVTLGGAGGRLPMDRIKAVLEASGFEILEDHRAKVIEKIKLAAQKLARHDHEARPLRIRASDIIA